LRNRELVRFARPFEDGHICGRVLDIGPQFFLIALLSDDIAWDGFTACRIADVRRLEPDPYRGFIKAALKKLGRKMPRAPKVSLANAEELLRYANAAFPLVTIHRDRVRPEACWIGTIQDIANGRVLLLEIGPDAKWDRRATPYKLREITTIEFGGAYEHALYVVGGAPPESRFGGSR